MSKFYGTLTSDKGESTRAGHRYMDATAQTFDGSVTVGISEREGTPFVVIAARAGSGVGGEKKITCKLEDFIRAKGLSLVLEEEGK